MTTPTVQTQDAQPTLVVIDRAWQSFEQFTAAMGHHGIRVVYIGVGLKRHSEVVRSVVYPESHFVPDLTELGPLLHQLAKDPGHRIADVLCNELDLAEILGAARSAGLPRPVVEQMESRLPFSDKVDAGAMLRAWGVPTLRSCPAGTPPEVVAEELGLPVVVKGRRGAGGLAVEFAKDLDDVRRYTDQLMAETGSTVFYEQFVPGRNGNYACVHANGRVLVDCAFDSVRSHGDLSRPPTDQQIVDEQAVLDIGRRIAQHLPGVGVFNIETMTADDVHHAVIDTNLRPFGGMIELARGGVDLAAAYAAALRDPDAPYAPVHRDYGRPLPVFPTSSEGALQDGVVPGVVDFARTAPRAAHELGPRYVALAGLAFATRTARRAVSEVRRTARRVLAR